MDLADTMADMSRLIWNDTGATVTVTMTLNHEHKNISRTSLPTCYQAKEWVIVTRLSLEIQDGGSPNWKCLWINSNGDLSDGVKSRGLLLEQTMKPSITLGDKCTWAEQHEGLMNMRKAENRHLKEWFSIGQKGRTRQENESEEPVINIPIRTKRYCIVENLYLSQYQYRTDPSSDQKWALH